MISALCVAGLLMMVNVVLALAVSSADGDRAPPLSGVINSAVGPIDGNGFPGEDAHSP